MQGRRWGKTWNPKDHHPDRGTQKGAVSEIGAQRPGSGADEVSRNCGEARGEVTI